VTITAATQSIPAPMATPCPTTSLLTCRRPHCGRGNIIGHYLPAPEDIDLEGEEGVFQVIVTVWSRVWHPSLVVRNWTAGPESPRSGGSTKLYIASCRHWGSTRRVARKDGVGVVDRDGVARSGLLAPST
jgi:hypothetical protein